MCHVTYEWVEQETRTCLMHVSCHIWMRHVTFECVMSRMNASCHIWMRQGTYKCVEPDARTCLTYFNSNNAINVSCYTWMHHVTYECVMSHMNESNIRMGWLRLVGSLKLQVSSAEYRLFYRALLQKRPSKPKIEDLFNLLQFSWSVISHINVPCHIWMRHATHECAMSHIKEPCYVWIRHVTSD